MSQVLLTGGAGYIGQHIAALLIQNGFVPIIFDNFANSSTDVGDRLFRVTGVQPVLINGDVREKREIRSVFADWSIDAVIHLAALKSISESFNDPLRYFDVNVVGTRNLIEVMLEANVNNIVYSSSATVYGPPTELPLTENALKSEPTNPYGHSKLMAENLLLQTSAASLIPLTVSCLRYFNPVGAHKSGLLGESMVDNPPNLVPMVAKAALDHTVAVKIFGDDYPTTDGTGVRDFIHVMDVAEAHILALQSICSSGEGHVLNLGTGCGYSVLEVIRAYEKVAGVEISREIAQRRSGDVASCYADPSEAYNTLGWRASRSLHDMCKDDWNWRIKESGILS